MCKKVKGINFGERGKKNLKERGKGSWGGGRSLKFNSKSKQCILLDAKSAALEV